MAEIKFPDTHWSNDWDLLRGIALEWRTIREMFQWKPMVQNRTVIKRVDEVLGVPAYPHINQLNDALRCDRYFCALLADLIQNMTELRAPHDELLIQMLLRCNMIIWRNGEGWLEQYEGKIKHWAVLCRRENLATELKRADKVICPGPRGEVRRPNVYLAFEPEAYHDEFDWVDAVEEMVSKGHATPLEGELFLHWFRHPDANSAQHADEHSVSTLAVPATELQRIVKKFSRHFRRS